VSKQHFQLTVVVPCHNTEKFMQKTIGVLYSQLNNDEELVLVENGSTDNTLIALKSLFGTSNPGNVIVAQSPKGLGLALKKGIELASGKKIVFMEDDLPFGLQELKLARKIDVHGRYFILSKYHGNLHGLGLRRIQGLVFIFIRETILGLNVRDSQATFFGDAKIVKDLAKNSKQKGFLVTLEFIALARKMAVELTEIPCDSLAKPIRATTLKLRDVFQMFVGLFEVKRHLRMIKIE
jgi:glycosyltransferase involved in cell wall biosynthesis